MVENYVEFPLEADRNMVVLCGMCAAFGALFPTPVLGVLLIYELGQPPKSFMESVLTLSVGSIIAFAIYYRFAENLYLERLASTGVVLSLEWDFQLENCITGLIFGVVSAGLCVVNILMIGVFRQVFNRIRDRADERGLSGTIVAPLIGGVAVGAISYVLPLTIGDGNMTLAAIVRQTFYQVTADNAGTQLAEPYITSHLLICSIFAKMFCIGVSMNCGFVGGFVFPLITVGAMAGSVASLLNPSQPIGLCIGAFMAAVPAGICPMVRLTSRLTLFFYACLMIPLCVLSV
jgi:H+/Cl- antiporter ClcA